MCTLLRSVLILFSLRFLIFGLFLLFYLDSGLESDYIQDDMLIGNGDKSPTVEDGTQQDETKNGHLGNILQ